MKVKTDTKKINQLLSTRYIERIFPSKKALKTRLQSGKRLTTYIGIDPTASHLHLGHSTNFLLLKKLQELGHRVVFLIGDFTARIGDPTGRLNARKPLTPKEIFKNCKSYKKQAGKILDFRSKYNPVKMQFNSEWLSKITLGKAIELMSSITVGQMIKRDMFQRRIQEKKEIYLHEFLYPLFQGYDSVAMKTDIEVGGNDQTFNMMIGRDLVRNYLHKEKIVIATKLLINPKTKRKLMSKSEGNFIGLDEKPSQMYGKIMALPDETILPIFKLCTELEEKEIKKIEKELAQKSLNPKEAKARLGKETVSIYYGEKEAEKAEKEFKRVFEKKQLPSKLPEVKIEKKKLKLLDLLVKTNLASSKSEAKRLVIQGGVRINKVLQKDWQKTVQIKKGDVIQVGKRRFVKIK